MTVKCGKDIYLRELNDTDYDRILHIVLSCAAHSTRKLYSSYKDHSFNQNFKHNINDIFENDSFVKLCENFIHLDDIMSIKKIKYGTPQFEEFLKELEEDFYFYPEDHLFFPLWSYTAFF